MSDENAVEQPVCIACKENSPESGYTFPLCQRCRLLLINRPFPKWIKVLMLIVSVLMLFSAFKFPIAFKAGIALKTAKKAEAISDYPSAILEYQKVLALFPESQEHKARLAICYLKTNKIKQAADIIKNIEEKKLSKEVVEELNELISKF